MLTKKYIYCLMYKDKENKIHLYRGVTNNLKMRIKDHLENKGCKTSIKFNKAYKFINYFFRYLPNDKYEITFGKYNISKKLILLKQWNKGFITTP